MCRKSEPEQFQNRGVYLDVFEQSLLIENPTNKSWSFLASVSAELVAVSLLILIPLVYADHLPEFHWRSVMVGPPPRPIAPPPVQTQPAAGPTRPDFKHPPLIQNPIAVNRNTPTASSQPMPMDLPALPIGDGPSLRINPIGDRFATPVIPGPPPTNTTVKLDPKPTGPIRVSTGAQMAKLIHQVIPVYPQMARATHTSGTVRLLGIIGKDGTIRNLQVISGHPLLTKAAMDAVSQWVYRPTLLSGEAVEVVCPIEVNFTLSNN
jgi:periplasmic protein TonB